MGHGPRLSMSMFSLSKDVIISLDTHGARTTESRTNKSLILMGQNPRLSKHKKLYMILVGHDPRLSKHVF